MHPKKFLLRLALALLFSFSTRAADEKPAVAFRSLAFDAACATAKTEGKAVLIDFYTTWCEPCKRLDRDTWTDAAVGKLVGEKAVALRLDAEKEGRDVAKRYNIDAYPTLLVLKADGTELDRIVGYREPAKFIEEFTAGLAGHPALKRAADAFATVPASGHDAVKARYDYARVLSRNHQYEEALGHYLWCYDEGMIKEPSYTGVRVSFLLSDIAQMGRSYPPALAALRDRRDAAEKLALGDKSNREAARDFASLNEYLKEDERTLAVFDQLSAGDPRRAALGYPLFKLLLKKQRYADALSTTSYERITAQFDRSVAMLDRPGMEKMKEANHRFVITTATDNVELLAGAGELEHARQLAVKTLAFDGSDDVRAKLKDAATRAGHPEAIPAAK